MSCMSLRDGWRPPESEKMMIHAKFKMKFSFWKITFTCKWKWTCLLFWFSSLEVLGIFTEAGFSFQAGPQLRVPSACWAWQPCMTQPSVNASSKAQDLGLLHCYTVPGPQRGLETITLKLFTHSNSLVRKSKSTRFLEIPQSGSLSLSGLLDSSKICLCASLWHGH